MAEIDIPAAADAPTHWPVQPLALSSQTAEIVKITGFDIAPTLLPLVQHHNRYA